MTEGGRHKAGKGEKEGHQRRPQRRRRCVASHRGRGMASQAAHRGKRDGRHRQLTGGREMDVATRKGKRDGVVACSGRGRGATKGRSRV